jgi:hypothetical protein
MSCSGRRTLRKILAFSILALTACVAFGLVAAGRDPYLVQNSVDWVRGIVGPGPVAAIENTFYQVADVYNRARYQITGDSLSWRLATPNLAKTDQTGTGGSGPATGSAGPAQANGTQGTTPCPGMSGGAANRQTPGGAIPTAGIAAAPITGSVASPGSGSQPATGNPPVFGTSPLAGMQTDGTLPQPGNAYTTTSGGPASGPAAPDEALRPLVPLINDGKLPGEGIWQPLISYGQPALNPILYQTVYRPDPQRPFARVALVAMDLTRTQLHLVIGTQEPASSQPAGGLRTGVIPADVQASGTLIAAWNGGFKAVHSHYGMMTDGVTWLNPIDGMGTVGIARDGHIEMGTWGQEILPTGDWLAWRQNNPPLIVNGVVNPEVTKTANTIRWGASINGAVFIWRSGMGMTQGHHWLIYAVGNSLSVATLTETLRAANSDAAMQLDVNSTWEQYITFAAKPQAAKVGGQPIELPLTGQKLIDQMVAGPALFLVPYTRDFFYLTYLPGR